MQLINVSGRFESSNVPASQRFTAAQNEELRDKGSFVWLNYRAGAEPERPLRRPYVVTQEELDAHANRRMDCLDQLPGRCMVLNLHGKGDGTGQISLSFRRFSLTDMTVPYDQAIQMDLAIRKGKASSDVMLLEAVQHNWDGPGHPELLASLIQAWILARANANIVRTGNDALVDHLGQNRDKASTQ